MGPWTVTVGPAGFLDLVATWLGVAMRPAPTPVRIASVLALLRESPGDAFWSASFAKDPWSTAQSVLALRDALCIAGWDGTDSQDTPPRISDLARISSFVAPGEPDLMAAVLASLRNHGCKQVSEVMLAEPAALWPFGWRCLFNALAERRIRFVDLALPTTDAGDDLQALRNEMRNDTSAVWRGDGSLSLLASETEIDAADMVSAWLGAGTDDLVVMKASGALLDPFLQARHLPRLGGDRGPPAGLLPLAFALRWDPFDAAAALEFLSLHHMPLGSAARCLCDAIQKSPGFGGPRFRDGIRRAVGKRLCQLHRDGVGRVARKRQARPLLDEIAFWLPARRYTRAEGLPAADVADVCEHLIAWAKRGPDPDAGAPTAALAAALTAAVVALRQDRISRPLLGRMLDAVASAGTDVSPAEAGPWRHATAPGALVSPTETLVWWLTDRPTSSSPLWRAAELRWMATRNVQPDDASMRRGREREALFRAVSQPTKRLVLVRSRAVGGDPAPVHPLLADLHACFGDSLEGAWVAAGSLRRGGNWAGRTLVTSVLASATPPAALRDWTVPAGTVIHRAVESPSGMEKLLGCPLAWLLQYGAGLRARDPVMLPGLDALIGNFLHHLLRRLFDDPTGMLNDPSGHAREIFKEMEPEEAAPLMQPGMEAARIRAQMLFSAAIGVLVPMLTRAGLEVEATEKTLRRPLPGGALLEGRLDLLLRRPVDGLRLVLDAKWTRSSHRHRKALAVNQSVQLAAYAWLTEALAEPVTAGFFLLRQAEFYIAQDEPFAGMSVAGSNLPGAWQRALHSYTVGLEAMQAGEVLAAGVADTAATKKDRDADLLVLDPPCRFCNFRPLCGAKTEGR